MTLQEKIQKKADGYGKLAPVFLEGAKFALENQWISVDEDLPYNHEELLITPRRTKDVIVMRKEGQITFERMVQRSDGYWIFAGSVTHWFPIPEPPKE